MQREKLNLKLSPFHDEQEAQSTWTELECELWMVTSLSDVSRVGVDGKHITTFENNLLSFALENIGFEDELDYGSLLTLTILNDSEQGSYLPPTSPDSRSGPVSTQPTGKVTLYSLTKLLIWFTIAVRF